MPLRSALEQATHRIVVRRRLPAPFAAARIYVSSEGGLRYIARRMTQVDPPLLRLATETVRPGDTVWDIGANLGLFSFAAAVAAGPTGSVLAVEPDATMARLLRRSAALNRGHAPVDVLPVAVSDAMSVARFHIARRNRSTNYLDGFGTSQTGGARATELVPTFTLDWLGAHFAAPDVIKIDVEEAEAAVLAGGSRVLELASKVICEVAARNFAVVRDTLNRHGYVLYDGDRPSAERVPVADAQWTTLAVRKSVRSASLPDGQPMIRRLTILERGTQVTVKELIRPLPGVRQLSLLRQRIGFRGSALYWEQNYARGGTSGPGSYDAAAEAKAAFLNDFVRSHEISSVIEFGCGDGHQLSLAEYPGYIGLDVSRSAIGLCQRRFAGDPAKSFFLYDGACFTDSIGLFTADLAISLDVIYHLIEDGVFDAYMTHLFAEGEKFVIIYATNREISGTAPHVRHRYFTRWADEHARDWRLLEVTPGPNSGPDRADFFTYQRVAPQPVDDHAAHDSERPFLTEGSDRD